MFANKTIQQYVDNDWGVLSWIFGGYHYYICSYNLVR